MANTIFALSSGAPPAGVAVIRVSGPTAGAALRTLAGCCPAPRRASLARLHDAAGALLDSALVLWLPGPGTVTGEDMAEIHCHGGRAVVAAVMAALAAQPGLRLAEAGEFTRRGFANGRIDLAEAEGLADLLAAETELQRKSALAMATGALSLVARGWREGVLAISAEVEAMLDFSDEDDVASLAPGAVARLAALTDEIDGWLTRPHAEPLRDGVRVVIGGPPNAGKSTLFNALVGAEAAITAPTAGTTRDVLLRPVALDGVPFVFCDTAGLRAGSGDAVEAAGIERAEAALLDADIVLWLGAEGAGPDGAWEIEARIDVADAVAKHAPRHRLSARTGVGVDALCTDLADSARQLLPRPGEAALNARQRGLLASASAGLRAARGERDPLLVAEGLRVTRASFDGLLGLTGTENMLDALFGRFCIGK